MPKTTTVELIDDIEDEFGLIEDDEDEEVMASDNEFDEVPLFETTYRVGKPNQSSLISVPLYKEDGDVRQTFQQVALLKCKGPLEDIFKAPHMPDEPVICVSQSVVSDLQAHGVNLNMYRLMPYAVFKAGAVNNIGAWGIWPNFVSSGKDIGFVETAKARMKEIRKDRVWRRIFTNSDEKVYNAVDAVRPVPAPPIERMPCPMNDLIRLCFRPSHIVTSMDDDSAKYIIENLEER